MGKTKKKGFRSKRGGGMFNDTFIEARKELINANRRAYNISHDQEQLAKEQQKVVRQQQQIQATLLEAIEGHRALNQIKELVQVSDTVKMILGGNEHHTVMFPTDDNLRQVGLSADSPAFKLIKRDDPDQFLKSYMIKGHHNFRNLKHGESKKIINLNGVQLQVKKHDSGKIVIKQKEKPLAIFHSIHEDIGGRGEKPTNGSLNTIKDISDSTSPAKKKKTDTLKNLGDARETVTETATNFAGKAKSLAKTTRDTVKNGFNALANLIKGDETKPKQANILSQTAGGRKRRSIKRKRAKSKKKQSIRKVRKTRSKRKTYTY